VNDFFDRFEQTAAGIPPENIWNCDETNLQENPGTVQCCLIHVFFVHVTEGKKVWWVR
jgi:hypothetical protein